MSILSQLPKQFTEFLQQEGIDQNIFQQEQTLRYIRLKPNHNYSIEKLKQLITPEIQIVEGIENIYGIPTNQKINQIPLYQQGQLYGIDLSSSAVVQALDINQEDYRILEICCAPGAKLTYIADLLEQFSKIDQQQRIIYGIDISENRLNITQSIVDKYKLKEYVKLIRTDGTTYKNDEQFDKILIDAECTHEGSIKHLKKFINKPIQKNENNKQFKKTEKQSKKQLEKNHTNQYLQEQLKPNEWSQEDFIDRFLDTKKLNQITNLQYNLLKNGFQLLKDNGYIIYSTCSFSRKQNEDIIEQFLKSNENAQLIELTSKIPHKPGFLKGTLRYDPITSNSGGMFVAKLQKIKINV